MGPYAYEEPVFVRVCSLNYVDLGLLLCLLAYIIYCNSFWPMELF